VIILVKLLHIRDIYVPVIFLPHPVSLSHPSYHAVQPKAKYAWHSRRTISIERGSRPPIIDRILAFVDIAAIRAVSVVSDELTSPRLLRSDQFLRSEMYYDETYCACPTSSQCMDCYTL
jgi:hypothetical protein